MTAANPLKRFMTWLNAEEDEEEMDSNPLNPAPPQAPEGNGKRQRGPLMLRTNQEGGMEIRHPRTLDERMAIGMDLKQRRTVALDLTKLPEADAGYFLAFVYGVVFALDATAEKVTDGIYLLAPRGMSVHNDVEMEDEEPCAKATSAPRATGKSKSSNDQEELFWQGN